MGAHGLMEGLIYGSKKIPHIGRAYLHQSIALVSICREIVQHVGLDPERNEKLEEAVKSLNPAFDLAREAGHEENKGANEALEKARDLVLDYLRTYHSTDKVSRDIAKQLQVLIAPTDELELKTKFHELHKKDRDAVQQLQRFPEMVKFKLRSLSARKKHIEVWIWLARLDSKHIESGVQRPGEMVFEEDLVLDHVLCRVLDHVSISSARDPQISRGFLHDKLPPNEIKPLQSGTVLALNPQFYEKFLNDEQFLHNELPPSQIKLLPPDTVLSNCPKVLHLVVDRQWRIVFDAEERVQVFGYAIKVQNKMVLKNKLGDLEFTDDLVNGKRVSFYSAPREVTLQEKATLPAIIMKAAEMAEPCNFLASYRSPDQLPFKALDWKPIKDNNDKSTSASNTSQGASRDDLTKSVLPIHTNPNPQPPNAPTKPPNPDPGKKKGLSGGRLQNVAQGVDFISSDMAPISQTFREEPKPTKKPKGLWGRIFG